MIESISTRVGRVSIDTNSNTIKLVSKISPMVWSPMDTHTTHAHTITQEQAHALIHALARAIGLTVVEEVQS